MDRLARLMGIVAAASIFLMMLFSAGDALLRYLFNKPVRGAFEIIEYSMVPIIFLSIVYTQSRGEHVRVEMFISKLKRRSKLLLESVMLLLALVFFSLLAWQGTVAALDSYKKHEASYGAITLTIWPAKVIVAFGAFMVCLYLVRDIIRNVRRASHPDLDQPVVKQTKPEEEKATLGF